MMSRNTPENLETVSRSPKFCTRSEQRREGARLVVEARRKGGNAFRRYLSIFYTGTNEGKRDNRRVDASWKKSDTRRRFPFAPGRDFVGGLRRENWPNTDGDHTESSTGTTA